MFDEWHFSHNNAITQVRIRGRFRINNGLAMAAACAGAGITGLDKLLVMKELATGELVEVMPDHKPRAGPPFYAVYPARDWLALKTATFIEFLQGRLLK